MRPFELNTTDFTVLQYLNKMGAMPVSSIAKRADINRTTVFSAIKRLKQKGLIYEVPKKGMSFFMVVDKENIKQQASQKLQAEKIKYQEILEFAEQLDQEKNILNIAPKVAFFEGESGIITLFQKTLTKNAHQSVFLTLDRIPEKTLHFLKNDFIEEKKKKKVFSKVLIPQSDRAKTYSSLDTKDNRETRFVPSDTLFETEIIISGNSVALIDFKEGGIGVLIESKSLSHTLQSIFDLVWKMAQK